MASPASRRLILGLLVLASVLIDAVVLGLDGPDSSFFSQREGSPRFFIALALVAGQTHLLAMFLALGSWPLSARLVVTWGAVVFFALAIARFLDSLHSSTFFIVLGYQAATVAGIFAVLHQFGFQLQPNGSSDSVPPRPAQRRRQFTIRDLLVWTAVTAVLLGSLRMLDWRIPREDLLPDLVFLWLVSQHVLLAGTFLGIFVTRVGLFVLWIVTVLLGPLFGGELLPVLCAELAYLCLSLFVVRVAGYRTVWIPRVAAGGDRGAGTGAT